VPDNPAVRHVSLADVGSSYESFYVDGHGDDGSATIRISRGGPDGRVASADATPEGEITDRIAGKASHKDRVELRTAQNLIARLNQLGADWGAPELQGAGHREERGVDCIARDDAGNELLIQVTTTDREPWAQLAREPLIVRSGVARAKVVDAIYTAIARKATRAAPDILLALDATDSPRAAFRSVVDSFRSRHGEWAMSIGFREVWLVGPVVALVQRLC
jgi:hypothetical protein